MAVVIDNQPYHINPIYIDWVPNSTWWTSAVALQLWYWFWNLTSNPTVAELITWINSNNNLWAIVWEISLTDWWTALASSYTFWNWNYTVYAKTVSNDTIFAWTSAINRIIIWWPTARLPSTYQEVEYIQSSWTQRIDSWVVGKNTTKVEIQVSSVTQSGSYQLIWADYNRQNRSYNIWVSWWCFWTWSWTDWTISWLNNGNKHTVIYSKNWYYLDWTLKWTPSYSSSFSTPVNLSIFSWNRNWSPQEYGIFKLYYLKIWDWTTLVRNFVPCYRKSDNVIWLYDLVNSQFYTNAGSWTFTKWSNQSGSYTEIQEVYAGTTKIRPYTPVPFTPDTSRTLLYLKFENNLNDSSGNGVTSTSQWISFWQLTTWYKYWYAYISANSNYDAKLQPAVSTGRAIGTWDFTISFWWYAPTFSNYGGMFFGNWYDGSTPRPWPKIIYSWDDYISTETDANTYSNNSYSTSKNTWYHYCLTRRSWTATFYLNWTSKRSFSSSASLANVDTFWLLQRPTWNDWTSWNGSTWARMSEVIYEKVWRTASEVSTYYEATKSTFGY